MKLFFSTSLPYCKMKLFFSPSPPYSKNKKLFFSPSPLHLLQIVRLLLPYSPCALSSPHLLLPAHHLPLSSLPLQATAYSLHPTASHLSPSYNLQQAMSISLSQIKNHEPHLPLPSKKNQKKLSTLNFIFSIFSSLPCLQPSHTSPSQSQSLQEKKEKKKKKKEGRIRRRKEGGRRKKRRKHASPHFTIIIAIMIREVMELALLLPSVLDAWIAAGSSSGEVILLKTEN